MGKSNDRVTLHIHAGHYGDDGFERNCPELERGNGIIDKDETPALEHQVQRHAFDADIMRDRIRESSLDKYGSPMIPQRYVNCKLYGAIMLLAGTVGNRE